MCVKGQLLLVRRLQFDPRNVCKLFSSVFSSDDSTFKSAKARPHNQLHCTLLLLLNCLYCYVRATLQIFFISLDFFYYTITIVCILIDRARLACVCVQLIVEERGARFKEDLLLECRTRREKLIPFLSQTRKRERERNEGCDSHTSTSERRRC